MQVPFFYIFFFFFKGVACERPSEMSEEQKWCPEGWSFLLGDCYRVFYRPVNWNQARDGCETHRSRLAYPKTPEDVTFLLTINAQAGVWLGASDIGSEGYFVGSDGDELPYSGPWVPNAPDNNAESSGEDCVFLDFDNETKTVGMNDESCHAKMDGFVCVRRGGSLLEFDSLCDEGWVFYKGQYYVHLVLTSIKAIGTKANNNRSFSRQFGKKDVR